MDIRELTVRFQRLYPRARIALDFTNPLELLVATILSAQCTDKKVNEVTKVVFEKYHSAADYANANLSDFEQEIRPTGFYHNKSKNIIGAARMILERYGGQVPRTMDELVTLPGVARKTANIVLYNAYNITEGIAVDTHVKRLAARLGLTRNTDPEKIEKELMAIVPRGQWGSFPYLLIEHGRAICIAVRPKCPMCTLNDICPSAFKV